MSNEQAEILDGLSAAQRRAGKAPWYKVLYVQVLLAVAIGIVLGVLSPSLAAAMKPLGDGFIKLIRMVIAFVVFFTVANGIAGMKDMRRVGRVGGKALIYFEAVTTIALVLGLVIATWLKPGAGFNIDPGSLNAHAVMEYAGKAHDQSVVSFLFQMIPETLIGAFATGNILQVIVIALLFGAALSAMGTHGEPVLVVFDGVSQATFRVVNIVMKLAPIGAFGAMAFTVGKFGIGSLGPLLKLIGTFYLTCAFFIFVILGAIARMAGFRIVPFLKYIREELLIVLGTSSSDAVLPSLMKKLERLGCSRPLVGLVVPTGYVFNSDGTCIYMTMATLFIAQATNIDLTLTQELTILAVALLTSKGASGVQGASFIALVGTLSVIPTVPVAGMALILGIDRFMSEARALLTVIGNAVATVVVARWEKELTAEQLKVNLNRANQSLV